MEAGLYENGEECGWYTHIPAVSSRDQHSNIPAPSGVLFSSEQDTVGNRGVNARTAEPAQVD
ncbi:hypothetical protein HC762_01665 [bacterium]|nr:hypothetical protein [bacterium]